jgi:hypothetical protein
MVSEKGLFHMLEFELLAAETSPFQVPWEVSSMAKLPMASAPLTDAPSADEASLVPGPHVPRHH